MNCFINGTTFLSLGSNARPAEGVKGHFKMN